MPFLKIDTSGMNARFGRTKVAPEKSRQVTEFNTPSKNRAPDIPKTEAKEGDILSYFDDGKGKVLTSFDGGYQSAMTTKVSDMNRVDLGMSPVEINASSTSSITFNGLVHASLIGMKSIDINSDNKTQYIPSGTKKLYLDGSQGGEVGAFIRTNTACEINEIIIDDSGNFNACVVVLESAASSPNAWTLEFATASGNNRLNMDTDDLFHPELSSGDMLIEVGTRVMLTRSAADWKIQSLSSLERMIMQTGTLQPITDDTYDLGASTKEWKDLYIDGVAYIDTLTATYIDAFTSTGAIDFNSNNMTNVDIDSGTIDGTTIGANSAAAGTFAAIAGTTIDATTDFTIGTTVITDDSIVMTPSTSDTVTIAGATNGILNVTTVDAAGTAGDINLTSDGQIVYRANDSAGHIFDINGTSQLSIIDGSILPTTNNDIDLGSDAKEFKDIWIDGTAYLDTVDIDDGYIDGVYLGSNAVCPEVTCTALNVNGLATIGDNLADTIVINSRLQLGGSSLRPVSTDNYDIGDPHETGTEARFFWKHLYMRGSINMMNIQSVPSTTETDCIALYATDVSSSSELKVIDEAENVTTLSPHNFSICGGPSEDMAWAYYSENKGKKINVDMLKLARLVEDLSGEKLVYTEEEKNET